MLHFSNQKLCYLYASATIFLWSTPFVLTRIALQSYTVTALSVLRFISASLFLILVACSKKVGFPELRDIPKFFLSGGIGFSIYMITFNTALKTISSATGSVVISTAPIITAIFALKLFHEKISLRGWLAIALAFAGILILTLWHGFFSIEVGVLWMLLSAVFASIYSISQRKYTKKYTVFQSAAYNIIAGSILLLVFLPETIPQVTAAPLKHTLILIFLGVFPSAIAGLCWTKSISLAHKTSDATNFMFATPLLSSLLAFLVAGETISISTIWGGIMIITGLVLFNTNPISFKKEKTIVDINLGLAEDPNTPLI